MTYYFGQRGTLKGFDLVYACTEGALNNNLNSLFAAGYLPDTWKTGLRGDPTKPPRIDARLGPPTVTLIDDGTGRSRSVDFHLTLEKGTFWYYETAGEELDLPPDNPDELPAVDPFALDELPQVGKLVEVPIANWQVTLRANLGFAQIVDEIERRGGKVPDFLKEKLRNLPSRFASLEYLFLDLGNAHLIDMSRIRFDGRQPSEDAKRAFKENLDAYLQYLRTQPNSHVLGAVATASKETGLEPTFKPTGATHSTFPKGPLRALNYLLVTDNRAVPTDPQSGIFERNWVQEATDEGVFVISRPLVFHRFFERLRDSLFPYVFLPWLKRIQDPRGRPAMGISYSYRINDFSCYVTPEKDSFDIAWKLRKLVEVPLSHIHPGFGDFSATVNVAFSCRAQFVFQGGASDQDSFEVAGGNPSAILQLKVGTPHLTRSAINHATGGPIDISDEALRQMGDRERIARSVAQYTFLTDAGRAQMIEACLAIDNGLKSAVMATNLKLPIDQLQFTVVLPAARNLSFARIRFDEDFNLLVSTSYR